MVKTQKLVSLILTVCLIISFVIIFYLAQGYQFDFRNRQIQGTGILVINSIPKGARVLLDGEAQSATNTSIGSLKPGNYSLEVQKDGYHVWKKEFTIAQELVTEVDALLTPLFPEFKPLTFTGVTDPLLSPDQQKIAYSASTPEEESIWILELSDRPFNLSPKPYQLIADTEDISYTLAQKRWSPDSTKILLELEKKTYLIDTSNRMLQETDSAEQLKEQWEEETKEEQAKRIQSLPTATQEKIESIPELLWSPDYDSILYSETADNTTSFKIIVNRPAITANPTITALPTESTPLEKDVFTATAESYTNLVWYPDGKHFIILEKEKASGLQGKLSLMGSEGNNRCEFFSGVIKDNHVFAFPNGSKVVILTSFNPDSEIYNLYSISLR